MRPSAWFQSVGFIAASIYCATGYAGIIPIELTPSDVGSASSSVFTTLPTTDPAKFGLTGADVRKVNFDFDQNGAAIPNGASITNQYSSLGVTMNGFAVANSVYGGPASAPNATTTPFIPGANLVFTFSVPVVAFGAINTSPDADVLQFWSGPDGTGTMLLQFADQNGTTSPNFNVDRFIGGFITDKTPIGSIVYVNNSGQIELDEFIFEVELDFFDRNPPTGTVPEPGTLAMLGLGMLGFFQMGRRSLWRPS